MSELDDSSDNCWIVIVGDNKAKNSEDVSRIEYLERSEWFKLTLLRKFSI